MFNLHSIFSSCLFMLGGREFQVYHDFLERKHSGTVKLYSGFFFLSLLDPCIRVKTVVT